MSDLLPVLAVALVLYGMKALPFAWRFVPRTPRAEQIFDLLPVALLMAMLIPPVLRPIVSAAPAAGDLLALGAVAAAFATCLLTQRAALGIGIGLAVLAAAEFV